MSDGLFGTSSTSSEHTVKLILQGKEEHLRRRFAEALETLNYKVVTEQPLHARRGAHGSARWDCSLETLDYPRRLTLSLKQINESAMEASFNYEVKSASCVTRGDRATLAAEARALAAIATQRDSAVQCSDCGTTVTDESRFCRRCGALVVVEVAEGEALRLLVDSRRGYHNLMVGMIFSLVALLFPLILLLIDTNKAFRAVVLMSSTIGAMGLFMLFRGMWNMHRALNPNERPQPSHETQTKFSSLKTTALPPRSAQSSITEGTTELLFPEEEEARQRVPIGRKVVDTAEVK